MDTQFKQRLTGAVILILLAVLLVPELLTGPKVSAPGPTSASRAPAEDDGAPLRSYDIDVSESRDVRAPSSGATPQPTRPTAPSAAAATPAVPSPPPGRPAASDVPVAGNPAPSDAVPAGRITSGKDDPAVTAMRGFAVQVGSFAARSSADRLAADLQRRRFAAFVAPVRSGGRQLFRVRVGPVADRPAAQSLAAQLKAIGRDGSIVPLS